MWVEHANVYAPIADRARSEPGRLAVVTPQGRMSFAGLDAAVAKAAQFLLSSGLEEGQLAGVDAPDNLEHLVLTLACARIGVAHVALPAADAPDLRAATARDLGLVAVISTRHERGGAQEARGARPVFVQPASIFNPQRPPPVAIAQSEALDWLVLRSSGTTGKAKHAVLSHAAAMLRSRRYGPLFDCSAGDIFWPLSRIEFVVAKQRTLFCLQRGAAICLPQRSQKFAERVRFAAHAGVTLACGTPSHMDSFATEFPRGANLTALRAFEARSATISEPLRRRFREAVGDKLFVVYASNEAEAMTLATPELQAGHPETVGVPVDGMTVEIVDESDQPLPAGEIGQVRVKGPGVVDSYLNDPEATARSIRNGWFYPGDLASFGTADALPGALFRALFLHGRTDDMMACDGVKIYPAEIERVLIDHAAVADAAAFPIRSQRYQHIPAAAVVVKSPVSEAELLAHCRSWLGAKAPVCVMILENFPRNATGKVLKRQLSEDAERQLLARAGSNR